MLNLILSLGVICISYVAALSTYRFFFHPLASYPGPKLTAVTFWVECYHDVFRRGQFIFKIQEWHEKYGPIIRINPNELHIDDYSFYETLYGGPGSKRDKYEPWCRMAGSLGSAFATPGHELHRSRRRAMQNFFSKSAITKIESLILRNVRQLEKKFDKALRGGEVLNVNFAYFALAMDVINQYCFDDHEMLSEDDVLTEHWYQTMHMGFQTGSISRHFPWTFPLVNAIPAWLVGRLSQTMKVMLDWREQGRRQVEPILNYERTSTKDSGYKTVFHEMRDSDLPPSEKGVERFVDEAQVFIGAGSETTSHMLSVTTYHLLGNKDSLHRLQGELSDAMKTSSNLEWAKLEQLPYLTPVGMTQYLILTNPTIFPEPKTFMPERWLNQDGSYNNSMNKLILSFGKGSRQCMGMNLAYAEMYITIARIFGRFELELYETDRDEVELAHDFFTAVPKDGSKGVRVRVKRCLTNN